ncbi:retrovirus-related pol polyprotein from transposon TNT 1-94 [Tanacetum coccineum]
MTHNSLQPIIVVIATVLPFFFVEASLAIAFPGSSGVSRIGSFVEFSQQALIPLVVPKLGSYALEDLEGDDLLLHDAEMEVMNMILLSIPNEIYNSVDACTSAKDMWKRVERLMRGTIQNKVDRETRFTNEFDQFVAEPGEALVSVYNRFAQLMNDLERNNMNFPTVTINTKFLNSLQPEWLKYVTQVRLAKQLTVDSFDDLFDYLQQFEKLVNASRAKKLEKSHDPLALVANTGSSSRQTSSYYVTHPTSVVDYDDEYQQDDVHNNSEDPLVSAMLLLAKAITQNFSNLTNNHLRASSNTRNQAIIQGDRGMNAPKETGNVQRTLRTPSSGNTSTVQCYNCSEKGHYARNCPKPRVRDSKYFMEQMLVAKHDEAGVILTDEQNDFLFADASRMEEIEELSTNICLMARIQPVDDTSDDGPSYDTIGDDQINSNIKFDLFKGNVNSGSVEKDTHVPDLCAVEKLARNAYQEAEKQRIFAQQVQTQNTHLTSQLEMYKERVRILESINKDNNYLNEFLEADERAKCYNKQAQSQLVRDRDIIRDLKKQRDKLDLDVKNYKRKNEELQKTHSILKRQMSEKDDTYHDIILDLEAKLKRNVDLILKLDSEDTLEDAFKSQQKMTEKMNDPIVVANKQNCWTINYKKLNALYKDFVPQKELYVEQKYFSSSSIPSVKILVSKDMPSESPLIKELDKIKERELDEIEKQNDLLKYQLLEASLKHDVKPCVLLNNKCVDKILSDELDQVKKKSFEIQESLRSRIKILQKDVQRHEKQSVDFELKLQHKKEKHKWDSTSRNKNTNPLDYSWISKLEKLENENTRSQTQKEIDELIVHVSEKTYACGAIRAENHDLLSTISELKIRLEKVEKAKSVNTKFDQTNGSQSFLCVTPLNKHAFQKKTDVSKTEENHVVSKPVTLQTSSNKQTGANQNKNVIKTGMYRVVTTQESQINKTKSGLSSTGMNVTSRVRRPMSKDLSVTNSVLVNSKKAAKNVSVYVRKNKQKDNTSANVISNKENVIDVDVANASKAKTLLCVSCMQNVLIPCHDKCLAKHKLNVRSNVRRTFSTNSRTPKSLETTYVAPKTRFSKKETQSKTLDTTSVVSKSKIDVESASKAKDKVVQIVLWVVDSGCSKHMTGDRSLLRNFIEKFMGTVRFGNDNFAAITGYGDYIHGNITICHVYYVEGLGHNLFSVGQFCDGDLEVAFRSNTCYVRNLEGDDLLTGGRESNLYTISISDMAASSPVCLMSKATSTKSWLWHRRLSHLNFGTINDLTRLDLVDGLPKFKYGKDHLCSACERGKSKKASHPPKLVPSDHSKLELLHMDLCGPMRVASINGKKYILVTVDDFSRYTWVYFLRSKDETPKIIKKFISQAQLNYQAKVCKIRTDNDTEFKNVTLKAHYEKLGIMQQFSIARTPQQNGVVERRNHTLVEAARTMLIFSKLPEFLWAKAVATTCFTQNRSIIHTRYNKTPCVLLRGRKPNIAYFYVFSSLCYPKNDRDDLGKMKPKADIGVFIGYSETSTAMPSEHDCLEPELHRINYHNSSANPMNTPSKEDLDNLFGLMFEDYFKKASSDTTINSAAQPTQVHEDSTSTSSIIVDTHEAPPVVTTSNEKTSPISLTEADEFSQEDTANFDSNA